MSLQTLFERILPCELDRAFAFISYSNKDSEYVWKDVCFLQEKGFNLWIDKNLSEVDNSWKERAMNTIKDNNCRLMIFYMSKSSVVSLACLQELQCRISQEARLFHGGNEIPWMIIETENVGELPIYQEEIYNSISKNFSLSGDKKNQMIATLTYMLDKMIPNSKIRVSNRDKFNNKDMYYRKIEKSLNDVQIYRFTKEEMYSQGIKLLSAECNYSSAIAILENLAERYQYLPAILMLVFIYETGICGKRNHEKANLELQWGSLQMAEEQWRGWAKILKGRYQYEEAVAFYSASAIKYMTIEDFLEAGKMWIKIAAANFEFTKKCVEEAGKLGSYEGQKLYDGLKKMPKEQFIQFAKNIQ